MRNLSNSDLQRVQRRLAELGFNPGPIDGIPGTMTSAAIIAFKKSIGFRPRDLIGPLTKEALFGEAQAAKVSGATVPPWMSEALKIKGLHERRNYSRLKKWFWKSVSWIDPRTIPWCGAFVLTCVMKALPGTRTPANPLGARNWAKVGYHCTPQPGAILVFWRGSRTGWQGHVGFYYGEDATHYHVLGGNQSNAVTISRVAKSRLIDARWPEGYPVGGATVLPTEKNISITTNEA